MSAKKLKQVDYRTNSSQAHLAAKLAEIRGVQRATMLRIVLSNMIEDMYNQIK